MASIGLCARATRFHESIPENKNTLGRVVRFNEDEDPSSEYFDINSEFVIIDNQFGYVTQIEPIS